MARRPAQFGSAQIKKKEPVRPLLVLLLIAAGAIVLFLWLQADSVDPVVTKASDPATEAAPVSEPAAAPQAEAPSQGEEIADWWYDVESMLYDAFESLEDARAGDCGGLEYAVSDLGDVSPRPEPPISAPFSGLVTSLDSALAACRSDNIPALGGAEGAAKGHLRSLVRALGSYGIPSSDLLDDV